MFKNYLVIALRNIKKHKGYSFINISGLAIGMGCCILILLWVQHELSYDRFHDNLDNIYRIIGEEKNDGEMMWSALTPPPMAAALKSDFPKIVHASRFGNFGRRVVKHDDKKFSEARYEHVDPDFFQMFSFDFVQGDPNTVFSDQNSVVLTETMASKYFGDEDPMGKSMAVENLFDVHVTGVIKDLPSNSSLRFDFLSPFALVGKFIGENNMTNWGFNSFSTFVQLGNNSQSQEVVLAISEYLKKHEPDIERRLLLQSLSRIHLNADILHNYDGVGDVKYVYIFSVLAFFVLLIACINFMNLSTARSGGRAKEVGIRKVAGAYRIHLIRQFFSESMFLSFISLGLAIIIVELFLPSFNRLAGKQLAMNLSSNIVLFLGLVVIASITGIISGSYPALLLSSYQPGQVLKGTFRLGSRGALFRKVLVVTQFSLSIFLIVATIIVYQQLDYIRNKEIGYNREYVICLRMVGDVNQRYESIKEQLKGNPNVLGVTASFARPVSNFNSPGGPDWEGRPADKEIYMNAEFVDYDYFETLKMEIVQGRSFSKNFSTDKEEAYVVNQELVRQMGLESPVGKRFAFWDNWGTIIGVVKDFHFQPLHNKINPLVFKMNPGWLRTIFVRIKPDDIPSATAFLESTWNRLVPDYPFEYSFLDESFERLYRAEERMGQVANYFTILIIFVACLGLFGLASFMAEKRTKEIGIRKVLGASVSRLVLLLSTEFSKWVIVANMIAWPAAYFVMRRWLQNFAYRISIEFWVFFLAAFLALTIAMLTVGYKAIKTAFAHPAKALRYE